MKSVKIQTISDQAILQNIHTSLKTTNKTLVWKLHKKRLRFSNGTACMHEILYINKISIVEARAS